LRHLFVIIYPTVLHKDKYKKRDAC